ncbi:MAG: class I tRNA ligase family protein [bacterium]
MKQYDHKKIEKKWQKEWEDKKIYKVEDKVPGKENYFTLVEFSYPSGNLHTGHWYAFSIPDIFARFKRMQGYNSLYPMGFDAFGLPAENAAIKQGADPKVWTYEQMDKMRLQLRSMGAMFDWDREIVSCAPEYYKWTQWMFNKFLANDLVYRASTKVNWCPKDQTILANEQVIDGKCERCGTEVIQRDQEQWMLRITKYADRLVDDLEKLDWPEEIKAAQRNWIGRSEGSELEFGLVGSDKKIRVFTTRADTIFGVTYLVLAPEHALVQELLSNIENKEDVEAYIDATKKKLELDRQQSKEKTGVELKGIKAINPANKEEIPIWIADYVLAGYGTGAIMAVPAHDERDFEFAKRFNLPIREVVEPLFRKTGEKDGVRNVQDGLPFVKRNAAVAIIKHWSEDKYLCLKWKQTDWRGFVIGGIEEGEDAKTAAMREIVEETGYTSAKFVKEIPGIVHAQFYHVVKKENRWAHFHPVLFELQNGDQQETSEKEKSIHDVVWIPREEMEQYLSWVEDMKLIWNRAFMEFASTEKGILASSGEFDGLDSKEAIKKITEAVGGKLVNTYRLRDWGISRQRYWGCPIPIVYDPEGKAHPIPEEHLPWLLPTDVDHTPDGTAPLARSKELFARTEKIFGAGWKPEVETMDAFVDSSWYFYRYLDNRNDKEFAAKERMDAWMPINLYMGGAEHTTMHVLYSRFWTKALYDLGLVKDDEAYTVRRNRGLILGPDGNKMSKSKGNVINPDEIVETLGADTVRLYLSFMGPYGVTVNYPWDPNGVVGVRRFLERVWKLSAKIAKEQNGKVTPTLHKTIKKMSADMEEYKFNTSIAQMMILLNEWEKADAVQKDEYKTLLRLLAPFAPHIAEELWHELGETESIHLAEWPAFDENLIKDETVEIALQINGKLRGTMSAAVDESEEHIKKAALENANIAKYMEGKTSQRVVYVKNRLINIVI